MCVCLRVSNLVSALFAYSVARNHDRIRTMRQLCVCFVTFRYSAVAATNVNIVINVCFLFGAHHACNERQSVLFIFLLFFIFQFFHWVRELFSLFDYYIMRLTVQHSTA